MSREVDKPGPPIFTSTSTTPKPRDNVNETKERKN